MHHFVKRGGDQAAESDHIGVVFAGGFEDLVGGNHDAEVDDLVAVAAEDDANDVFADIVDVAFDGGHEDTGAGLSFAFDASVHVGQ